MCGRYYFEVDERVEFHKLNKKIKQLNLFSFAQKEVFPSQDALAIVRGHTDYDLAVMKWGIPCQSNQRIINARNESVHEKLLFKNLNYCLLPCNGYYEWQNKRKVYIQNSQQPLIYLAGMYNEHNEFVVITCEAQSSLSKIHHRMPLLVEEAQMHHYLEGALPFVMDNQEFKITVLDENKYYQESLWEDI